MKNKKLSELRKQLKELHVAIRETKDEIEYAESDLEYAINDFVSVANDLRCDFSVNSELSDIESARSSIIDGRDDLERLRKEKEKLDAKIEKERGKK